MNKIFKEFLIRKDVTVFILMFSIFAKSIQIFLFTYIGRDRILHLVSANNVLSGKGFTTNKYFFNDLSLEVLEPFCLWPLGYAYSLIPFKFIFGDNIILTVTVVEILFFLFFVLINRLIVFSITNNQLIRNGFTILICFFPYHFITTSLGTDLPALCFLLAFTLITIKTWENGINKRVLLGILAACCLSLAALIRYMYLPLNILIASIPLIAFYWNYRKLHNVYIILLSTTMVLSALQYVLTTIYCYNPIDTIKTSKDLFPGNLKEWFPVVQASLSDLIFPGTILTNALNEPFRWWLNMISIITPFTYLLLFAYFFYFFILLKKDQLNKFQFFILQGLAISFFILFELALLSITNAPQEFNNGLIWTYVIEGRYFAYVVIFLQQLFIIKLAFINTYSSTAKKLLIGISIIVSLTVLHEIYFSIKTIFNYPQLRAQFKNEQDYFFFENYLKDFIKKTHLKIFW